MNKNFEGKKQELYKYLNENLNLNVKDRNTIMFDFNTFKNLDAMKQRGNALKKTRASEKIVENRKKLEELLKPMNLTEENKTTLLKKFDNTPGDLESFEANAKSLIEQRKNEKRSSERASLMNYMNTLGLSGENKNMITGFFNQSPNKTLNSAKNNASTIKQTREQERLENTIKKMSYISENNKTKLRTNLKSGMNINQVINSVKRINAVSKSKKATEQNVIDYVTGKNLGENGNKLIKNFKNGLLTVNKVREEATKKRASLNADIVTEKKKNIRDFMKNTLLTDKEKNGFINRVVLDTNLSKLEQDIQKVDKERKDKRAIFAGKQSELQVVLNGLTNLTMNQKTKFMSRVKNVGTNIESIKREAQRIDDAKKKGKQKTSIRTANKTENNFNAGKALNILNKQRAGEAKRKERAMVKNNSNAIYTLDTLNTMKDARELQNYVRSTSLPEKLKKSYLAQLNRPGTNLRAIRGLVEVNIREDATSKLKKIKGLINADIKEFAETRNFNKARKRGAGRLEGTSVTKERAKPEKPNTFNASTAFNNLNLKPKRNALIKKAKNVITNPFGRIGKWNPAITNAKTMNELNTIEKNLNARVKLRNNIKRSTLTPKEQREYTTMVMKLNKNVKNTRNLFEKDVNKKVSNVTGPLMKGILNKWWLTIK